MPSWQQLLFKAGVKVLFWPQMNPVSEHPQAPAVLFHPAKHYLRFVSANITAGWRCSLTQFCHSNLGHPQHFQYYVYFCSSHHFNSRVRELFHVQLCWQNWGRSELWRRLSGAAEGWPGQQDDHSLKHATTRPEEGQPTSFFNILRLLSSPDYESRWEVHKLRGSIPSSQCGYMITTCRFLS